MINNLTSAASPSVLSMAPWLKYRRSKGGTRVWLFLNELAAEEQGDGGTWREKVNNRWLKHVACIHTRSHASPPPASWEGSTHRPTCHRQRDDMRVGRSSDSLNMGRNSRLTSTGCARLGLLRSTHTCTHTHWGFVELNVVYFGWTLEAITAESSKQRQPETHRLVMMTHVEEAV